MLQMARPRLQRPSPPRGNVGQYEPTTNETTIASGSHTYVGGGGGDGRSFRRERGTGDRGGGAGMRRECADSGGGSGDGYGDRRRADSRDGEHRDRDRSAGGSAGRGVVRLDSGGSGRDGRESRHEGRRRDDFGRDGRTDDYRNRDMRGEHGHASAKDTRHTDSRDEQRRQGEGVCVRSGSGGGDSDGCDGDGVTGRIPIDPSSGARNNGHDSSDNQRYEQDDLVRITRNETVGGGDGASRGDRGALEDLRPSSRHDGRDDSRDRQGARHQSRSSLGHNRNRGRENGDGNSSDARRGLAGSGSRSWNWPRDRSGDRTGDRTRERTARDRTEEQDRPGFRVGPGDPPRSGDARRDYSLNRVGGGHREPGCLRDRRSDDRRNRDSRSRQNMYRYSDRGGGRGRDHRPRSSYNGEREARNWGDGGWGGGGIGRSDVSRDSSCGWRDSRERRCVSSRSDDQQGGASAAPKSRDDSSSPVSSAAAGFRDGEWVGSGALKGSGAEGRRSDEDKTYFGRDRGRTDSAQRSSTIATSTVNTAASTRLPLSSTRVTGFVSSGSAAASVTAAPASADPPRRPRWDKAGPVATAKGVTGSSANPGPPQGKKLVWGGSGGGGGGGIGNKRTLWATSKGDEAAAGGGSQGQGGAAAGGVKAPVSCLID